MQQLVSISSGSCSCHLLSLFRCKDIAPKPNPWETLTEPMGKILPPNRTHGKLWPNPWETLAEPMGNLVWHMCKSTHFSRSPPAQRGSASRASKLAQKIVFKEGIVTSLVLSCLVLSGATLLLLLICHKSCYRSCDRSCGRSCDRSCHRSCHKSVLCCLVLSCKQQILRDCQQNEPMGNLSRTRGKL